MSRVILAVLWTASLKLGLSDVKMPYYLEQHIEDEVGEDDNKQAVQKVRLRIAQGLNTTYGVVMVATSGEMSYSVHTIPIWKAYCEKHGYDFFLQEANLAPGVRDHWTKPRVLMELVAKTKWKYIWLVDANSLPVDFEKGWQYAIKEHLRKQRYKNDAQKERLIWCPEDCESDYEDSMQEGACYGPHVSGCIFWAAKPKKLLPILKTWYQKRKTYDTEPRGLKMGFVKARESSNYDLLLWTDVGKEMGRADSNFLATHNYDEKLGHNLRDQVVRTIGKYEALGNVLNKDGQHEPWEEAKRWLKRQQEL